MRKLFVIALALVVLVVLLVTPAVAQEAKKEAPKDAAKQAEIPAGQKVFMDAKCGMCHTVYSMGIGEPPAADAKKEAEEEGPPDLSEVGTSVTAEWLKLFLTKKETLNDKKHMMSFKGSDEDLNTLVSWLVTLKPAEETQKEGVKASGGSAQKTEEGATKDKAASTPSCGDASDKGAGDKGAGTEDKKGE
jgi:mono/diheme cytochrome c family protein